MRANTYVINILLLCVSINAIPSGQDESHGLALRDLGARQEDHEHDHGHMHGGSMDGGMSMGDEEHNVDDASSAPDVFPPTESPNSSSTNTTSSPSSSDPPSVPHDPASHSHSHGSHTAPKEILDDAGIHYWHHFPPTYLAADFKLDNDSAIFGEEFPEDWEPSNAGGRRGLMFIHIAAMCFAYFGALPIALALRAAGHPSHYIANAGFLGVALIGWLAGVAYKTSTPDRYQGAVHGTFGNLLLLVSISLAILDSLGLIQRAFVWYKGQDRSWNSLFGVVRRDSPVARYEMVGLVEHEDEDLGQGESNVVFAVGDDEDDEPGQRHHPVPRYQPRRPSLLIRQISPPSRHSTGSVGSDGTLHESPPNKPNRMESYDSQGISSPQYDNHPQPAPQWQPPAKSKGWKRTGEILLTWARRVQVVIAYVVLLTGITIYLGMCRAGFINTCAAHLIKGSIFFGYGVLTFARYLGAYADLGWAWNRRPDGMHGPSAEMIECAVIFTYGITNTWMERFGSHPGDPYTVKQVQHISIAIMFWFAGLTGMLLESRKVRRILGSMIGRYHDEQEPVSSSFSFNPLPALVIAVTGLAMAAHHQDYVFQVQIHSLWGILLAGGSFFRLITYLFLFLRPPVESTLPSRPPSEVLTSFGWAAGGIVFMFSDEEVTFAAMRAGYDDMMAFLNITIALTSFVFCWIVLVMATKGYAVMRRHRGKVGDV